MTQHAARPEAVSYPAADLDRRFYAFVIDRLLAWSAFAGAGYVTYRLVVDDRVGQGVGVAVGTVLVVSLIYAVLLGVAGISPGKALVGLRVVRARDGRPVGIVVGLLRTLILGIATLPTFGLGLATLAWTALADPSGRRRGAHDRWTQTIVVDVRPTPAADDEGRGAAAPDRQPHGDAADAGLGGPGTGGAVGAAAGPDAAPARAAAARAPAGSRARGAAHGAAVVPGLRRRRHRPPP